MNKHLLPCVLALLICALSRAPAQVTTTHGAGSDAINARIHKLDLLIKLVPLALQKEQYGDLLAGIDRARVLQKAEQDKEDAQLAALDGPVSDAVTSAVEKGVYPPRELQNTVAKSLDQMSNRQIIVGANMVKVVYDAIQAKLNAGQRKVMAGSFSASFVDSRMKPEDITDEIKIRFYVRSVLLDPAAYDLLTDMSKHAS